jgi:Tat protein secretion system quality control protein TatD with DNase activity
MQRDFAALCQKLLISHDRVTYEDLLKILKSHTPYNKKLHINAQSSFLFIEV